MGDRAGISQDSVVCEGVKATGGDGNPPPDLKQPVVGVGARGKTGEVPAGTTELYTSSSSVVSATFVVAGGNRKAKADVARAAPVPAAIKLAVLGLAVVGAGEEGGAAATGFRAAAGGATGTDATEAFTTAGAGGGAR